MIIAMSKFNDYPHVFQPIQIGNMLVKNRIQWSPIVSNHAEVESGLCTPELIEFIAAQARTGVGIVTIGATPIDFDRGRDFFSCLSVTRDTDTPYLKRIANEVHRYGAKISVELTHAGRMVNAAEAALKGKPALAPSVIPGVDDGRNIKSISREEMDQVIQNMVAAVKRCIHAGFDMVMVHMGHGNLFSSFLTPAFNLRKDEYGGSLENRMRFPLEVLKAVREVAEGKINVEMRIAGKEYIPNSSTLEERIIFLKEAQKYVDLVNISAGTLFDRIGFAYNMPGYYIPPKFNVEVAAEIKKHLDIPVSVVGGISTIEDAEEILASGAADIVLMAKALIADEELVKKAYRGKAQDIRPCLRCMFCLRNAMFDAPLGSCAVNPRSYREKYRILPKAENKKKVMVIGGGPAGMEAAQTLVKRGHEVVLYEKENQLGGRLYEASALYLKEGFRRYIKWVIRQTENCGAKIILGTTVTPELIAQENPDAVIVAIGAETLLPPIKGIDLPHVITVSEADRKLKPIGEKVVICGGGLSGSECAIELGREGKNVTLVDALPEEETCKEMFPLMRPMVSEKLREFKVNLLYETKVTEIADKGVIVTDKQGQSRLLEADTVIVAFGLRQNKELIEQLCSVVPETYVVGDAYQIGLIGTAVNNAFDMALEV